MLSLGSSSKRLPHDSLSSPAYFMFSESDRTEDKSSSGAFLEGEGETGSGKPSCSPFTLGRQAPESPEACLDYVEHHSSEHENDQTGHDHKPPKCAGLTSVSAARDPKKGVFSHKCMELHGYVRPLLELLNGLKTGRYDRGLSTFQQSIAMDRLQRIVGILQKPPMGEKYMHTLLQVEIMLKIWFPQVAPCAPTSLSQNSTSSPPPHQHQLPVKKRRLNSSDPELQSLTYSSCKCTQDEDQGWHPSHATAPIAEGKDALLRNEGPVIPESQGICNLEMGSNNLSLSETQAARGSVPSLVLPPPSTGGCCLDTQDCSVSSTTLTSDPY